MVKGIAGGEMKRGEVLERAAALVEGDRAETYGHAAESHAKIAALWSVVLGHEVSAYQVALCMAALKLARAASNPNHADSFVDLAGYAAIAAEIAANPPPEAREL